MAKSLLCETVTAQTTSALRAAREAATVGDLVELRVDGVTDLDLPSLLADRRRPVIVTCRAKWEGGGFEGAEADRKRILAEALDLGAELIDVEWRAGFDDLIARAPARVVISMHDFEGVPTDLVERARAMRATGAGTIKIAVTARRLCDTLPLMAIAAPGDAVVIGMGDAGVPSRLLAARYGSKWSYAGQAVAPGQIPAARMVGEFRFHDVSARTRVFGVVSTNAMHSLSPVMHNAALAAAGLDAIYVPLRTETFEDFIAYADAIGLEGASVTIPFKLEALRLASASDALTRSVGAANTLRRRRSGWDATNTDVAGFLAPLAGVWAGELTGARAAILGAGGSARAVAAALRSRGVVVTVHARRIEQARALVETLGHDVHAGAALPAPGAWDMLINCTPLGGGALRNESPFVDRPLDGRLVYDLTYGEGESRLISDARAAGCLTLDGLPMLIAQAEHQFEWWTGQRPLAGVMRAAADRRLGRAQSCI